MACVAVAKLFSSVLSGVELWNLLFPGGTMRAAALMFSVLMLTAAGVRAQNEQPYHPGNGVSTPVLVKEVRPVYPEAAKPANIQGTVLMEGVVREDGTIGDLKIVRSLDKQYGCDEE